MEVHRVLRERAISVNLLPEVESECREQLSVLCSSGVQRNEVSSLQRHNVWA